MATVTFSENSLTGGLSSPVRRMSVIGSKYKHPCTVLHELDQTACQV